MSSRKLPQVIKVTSPGNAQRKNEFEVVNVGHDHRNRLAPTKNSSIPSVLKRAFDSAKAKSARVHLLPELIAKMAGKVDFGCGMCRK
jgi:hypothetical protein